MNADGFQDKGIKILKTFTGSDRASNRIIGKSFAQNECESYCSLEVKCWGCSEDFQKSNKWNAITDLDTVDHSKNTFIGAMAQKTGSRNRTVFDIERK